MIMHVNRFRCPTIYLLFNKASQAIKGPWAKRYEQKKTNQGSQQRWKKGGQTRGGGKPILIPALTFLSLLIFFLGPLSLFSCFL